MVKTAKGFVRRETTSDGRESVDKWIEREQCSKEHTASSKKRQKKAADESMDIALNY